MSGHQGPGDSPLQRLLRWEEFGGHWRIRARTALGVDIALLTCDGGEETDRMETDEDEVIAYVANRSTDQDEAGGSGPAS